MGWVEKSETRNRKAARQRKTRTKKKKKLEVGGAPRKGKSPRKKIKVDEKSCDMMDIDVPRILRRL